MKFDTRLACASDFAAFEAFQEQVVATRLAPHQRADGFVSTEWSRAQLEEVVAFDGLFVSYAGARMAGWVFGLPWDYCLQRPLFRAMVARFPLPFNGAEIGAENSWQWGPVAVAPGFRGQGALEAMFAHLKAHFAPQHEFGATFVSAQNPRSMAAHTRKLGMSIVDSWEWNGAPWHTLAFQTA